MSFNPFATGGIDIDALPYYTLKKSDSPTSEGENSYTWTLIKTEPLEDYKTTSMGTIDISDMFVKFGEVLSGDEIDDSSYSSDKMYLHLILANADETEVYIDVSDLVDKPDANKIPLDNDGDLSSVHLNLLKKILGDTINAETSVEQILYLFAKLIDETEIWAEEVRVKNSLNGGTYTFKYVFNPQKATDEVQTALENIDEELSSIHDALDTIPYYTVEENTSKTTSTNLVYSLYKYTPVIGGTTTKEDVGDIEIKDKYVKAANIVNGSSVSGGNTSDTYLQLVLENGDNVNVNITNLLNSNESYSLEGSATNGVYNYTLYKTTKTEGSTTTKTDVGHATIYDSYVSSGSLSSDGKTLTLNQTNKGGTVDIDVSKLVNNDEIYVSSGELSSDGQTLSLTRTDGNTVDIDVSNLVNAEDTYISGGSLSVDDTSATLVLNKSTGGTVKIDLSSLIVKALTGTTTTFGTTDVSDSIISLTNAVGEYTNTSRNAERFNDYENNIATGDCSHAEGSYTEASGDYSHAGGYGTIASGKWSYSSGNSSVAGGNFALTHGLNVNASNNYEIAFGKFNETVSGDYSTLMTYGNGTSDTDRSNLLYLNSNGSIWNKENWLPHLIPEGDDLNDTTKYICINKCFYANGNSNISNLPPDGNLPNSDDMVGHWASQGFFLECKGYGDKMESNEDYQMTISNYPHYVQILYAGDIIWERAYTNYIQGFDDWHIVSFNSTYSIPNDTSKNLDDNGDCLFDNLQLNFYRKNNTVFLDGDFSASLAAVTTMFPDEDSLVYTLDQTVPQGYIPDYEIRSIFSEGTTPSQLYTITIGTDGKIKIGRPMQVYSNIHYHFDHAVIHPFHMCWHVIDKESS